MILLAGIILPGMVKLEEDFFFKSSKEFKSKKRSLSLIINDL